LPATDTTTSLALAGRIDALGVELAALDGQDTGTQQPLSLSEVQALLKPAEGLVMYFVGEEDTFAWALTPTRAAWQRVSTPKGALAEDVALLRASLIQANTLRAGVALRRETTPKGPAFEQGRARRMHTELLGAFAPLLGDVRHLFTVADGPLTALPFALLVTEAAQAGDDSDPAVLRATPWLFQRHALTTLPGVESLAALRAVPRTPPAQKLGFLGFGNPLFDGTITAPGELVQIRAGAAGLDDLRALAPLPGTRGELRALARTLNAAPETVIPGANVTETAVRAAALSSTDVIAFATHGLLSGDLRGLSEPALVLTPPERALPGDDGLLTASEIAAMDIPAEWVILSACNTAGGDGRPDAEGLSGLARAFLFAGARSLIVSHWPVRDDAAARLTTDMFALLSDGTPRRRAEALQGAMQAMLDDTRDPTLAHPAAWAPFVIVGEGGF